MRLKHFYTKRYSLNGSTNWDRTSDLRLMSPTL